MDLTKNNRDSNQSNNRQKIDKNNRDSNQSNRDSTP